MGVHQLCFFFVLCGIAYSKHLDGRETLFDKILPELTGRLGNSVAVPGISHSWVERTFIFKSDCSMTCAPGKASTLASLENYNLESLGNGNGIGYFGFSNLQYRFDDCKIVVLSTVGYEPEYGLLGDHRVIAKISYENNQSQCLVKLNELKLEFLDNVMINNSSAMKLLKNYRQYETVVEKIRRSVMSSTNNALAKTKGMQFVVPGRCEDMQ